MSAMTENGLVAQSPHEVLGSSKDEQYPTTPGVDVSWLKQSTAPLFSQQILTVEQLNDIAVDPDVQTAVDTFLKGLTTQMFARIVRNGSAEVGKWLGAKIQGERDGWTAMLRMAMDNIELHRKTALRGQVVLHNTLEQLKLLVDCFQLEEDVKKEVLTEDLEHNMQSCVQILAECCNALMEDRFNCLDIIGCAEPTPDLLATAVQQIKDQVKDLQSQKESVEKELGESREENCQLETQNQGCLEEIEKMEETLKGKQEDLQTLKTQLQQINTIVMVKNNTADKCVGTMLDLFNQPLHTLQQQQPQLQQQPQQQQPVTNDPKPTDSVNSSASRKKDHALNHSFREPSLIELSEEKLRLLKERARKLESSLHGAIANMDKLRKTAPGPKTTPSSSAPATTNSTMFVALSSHRDRDNTKAKCKAWTTSSFQVSSSSNSLTTVTVPVPKLGHFQPTERRCFSERPPGKSQEDLEARFLSPDKGGKGEKGKAGTVGSRSKTGQVSKCLRCQKLFTATDNHKLACCYHSKGKERLEVYSDGGQLVRVNYVWKCCRHQGDSDGCCYGPHI